MKHFSLSMLMVLFCAYFGCRASTFGPLTTDTTSYQADIQKVNSIYGKAFSQRDSSLFMSCYASDASIMPPNAPVMSGVRGQLAFYKFAYKSGVRDIKFTSVGFFGYQGEYVTEQGSYE